MKICKIFTFDSAHYLPNHTGKCRNLHGHTYRAEIEVEGESALSTGMVMDFGDLKDIVTPIIDRLDHHLLNDTIPYPTAEYICEFFMGELRKRGLPISRIRIWETPTSYAETSL